MQNRSHIITTYLIRFFYSHIGEWSPNWVHSARGPLNGLLYLAWVIVMMMENLVEWRLAGETEVLGENLPQCHFVHHKSHLPDPGSNPGRRGWKPATNRLSYGAAILNPFLLYLAVSRFVFHFDHFIDGRTLWTSDQLVARPLPKHRAI
jgi:hypothetical protein